MGMRVVVRGVAVAGVVVVAAGCGTSGGGSDTAARDQCEASAGVGQCVERNGMWVPLGSKNGTTTAPTSTTTATSAPPATLPTSTAPTTTAGPGNVNALPAGLFCRDLKARSFSYSAAVDYWRDHGQPNQMDADRNGIPCETVFPRSDVASYWGLQTPTQPSGGLRSGLLCKDLHNAGLSYPQAVGYWYADGAPDRMDVDGNGIPCETVYSSAEVVDYWGIGG